MSCWASTASIWLSSPTTRQFLWWRLRRLSPRSYSVSSRPSLRIPRRTTRLPAWTKWTLRTIYEMTLSTGRRCGLAGWDYQGKPPSLGSKPAYYYRRCNLTLVGLLVTSTGAGTSSCRRPTMTAGASASWGATRRATASSLSSSKPLFQARLRTLTGAWSTL